MRLVSCQNTAFYRPRQPCDSPLHRLAEERYEEFERVYPERFQARYRFFRPVIHKAVFDYLKCGDPREGFARVRCPDCRHEFFVAFSCKQRCICLRATKNARWSPRSTLPRTSAHRFRTASLPFPLVTPVVPLCSRRALSLRSGVFTMPKRFRIYFSFNRELLRNLPRLAWETVLEVCRAVLDRNDVVPGMVAAAPEGSAMILGCRGVTTRPDDRQLVPD